MSQKISTKELKKAYRKAVDRYLTEPDPLKKNLYLRMSYAIKVDLAMRIRFKSATRSPWKQFVQLLRIAKNLSDDKYPIEGGNLVTKENDE